MRLRAQWVGDIVAAVAALTLVFMSGALAKAELDNPRDEAGYVQYLNRYGKASRHAELPPSADLIAAGDRACDWLEDQPMALWRRSSRFQVQNVIDRWLSSPESRDVAWDGAPTPSSIRAGAWSRLCPATFKLVEPHAILFLGHHNSD